LEKEGLPESQGIGGTTKCRRLSPKCSMSNTGAVAKHTSDMLGKIGEVMATKWAKEL
jgi:hypothetical protein